MDTPALLGAALAFSTVALPTILVLFVKNINKTNEMNKAELLSNFALLKSEIKNNNLEFENKIEKLIDTKLSRFKQELNLDHKKLSVDTLDKISSRLIRLGEKHNKDFLENIYED